HPSSTSACLQKSTVIRLCCPGGGVSTVSTRRRVHRDAGGAWVRHWPQFWRPVGCGGQRLLGCFAVFPYVGASRSATERVDFRLRSPLRVGGAGAGFGGGGGGASTRPEAPVCRRRATWGRGR